MILFLAVIFILEDWDNGVGGGAGGDCKLNGQNNMPSFRIALAMEEKENGNLAHLNYSYHIWMQETEVRIVTCFCKGKVKCC